ncbi:MAG: DUF4198 domain-containing protein [Rhizobiaceae bacterium]
MAQTLFRAFILVLAAGLAPTPAFAHFLELIPSANVLPRGGDVTIDMRFTHPFDGGPVMRLDRPVRFGVMANGQRIDLTAGLSEPGSPGDGFRAIHRLAEPGAAIFYVEPTPYYEPAEDRFIVQFTKVIVDSWASGEGWDDVVGLPVEIVPLTRPTGLWSGNLFQGRVMRAGVPVAAAPVEVEYRNMDGVVAPNDAFVTQVTTTDADGVFTWAMPRAGWWGFAALTEAETGLASPDGREVPVEADAVIWVKATAMPAQ